MGQDMKLSGSEVEAFREKVAIAIQESYDFAAHRFGCGLVAPPFIPGFCDRAADNVVTEAAKFFQKRAEQLSERCYDCGADSVAYELANHCSAYSELLVLGLREQIAGNLKYLVPLLKAKSKIYLGGAKDAVFSFDSDVHIVTIGQEPVVRACVFSSGTSPPKKLIHSDQASDATGALNSLLKKTQSMLATQLGVGSKVNSKANSSMSTKVGSAETGCFSSTSTKVASSKFLSCAAPTYETPITEVPASKVKSGARANHARDKSTTGFWDSSNIHNASFHESCAEPTSDGGDSGFRSRDGEPHPNRSYNDLPALAAIPASIQHAKFMTEVTPEVVSEKVEEEVEVAPKVVDVESDKFF